MVRTGTWRNNRPDDNDVGPLFGDGDGDVDQDPVRALHDRQEEAGGDDSMAGTYSIDTLEAAQLHVDLDRTSGQEPTLD